MAQPTLWPKKTFFYPVGNTTPCCFTRELAPEQNADVLLLACGDPRSILFTVHTQPSIGDRKLDFTCCDWEPAVIARNVLLFSMILDDVIPSIAWEIFYHFFLSKDAHDILLTQCRVLIKSSLDNAIWKASKYGRFLRICTDHTLAEIRRHWVLYEDTARLLPNEKRDLKASSLDRMRDILSALGKGADLGLATATGPLVGVYFSNRDYLKVQSHKELWTTGVTSSKLFRNAVRNLLNPTFVYSLMGEKFNVHYGTDPLKSFFLAPGLASIKDKRALSGIGLEDLVKLCMEQFSLWYTSFAKKICRPGCGIIIRFFVGEALAFCRALRYWKENGLKNSGSYTSPWGGSLITLDDDDYGHSSSAPKHFDVIDTSNLTDHCGLLNLLVVAIPLLRQVPSSVIHTNTLLPSPENGPVSSGLPEKACADIPTLSLLLGISPTSFTSPFTTISDKHHIPASISSSGQLNESISWKLVSSITPGSPNIDQVLQPVLLACDPQPLSQLLFSVYHRMFAEENQAQAFLNLGLSTLRNQSLIRYQRASFVAFLQLVKARVYINWEQTIENFLDLVEADRTFLMGAHSYQELSCQLHLRDLYTVEVLRPLSLEMARTPRDRLRSWRSIPPVVCVVLKVPRRALKVLEDIDADVIGTPLLQCESSGHSFQNIHLFLQPIFGDIRVQNSSDEPDIEIIEDTRGINGDSPLIITFYMPSIWLLTSSPVQIGFHLHTTPATIRFIPKLGMQLSIFSTSLTDTEHVQVVRHRPGNREESVFFRSQPKILPPDSASAGKVNMIFDKTRTKVTSLVIRDNINDGQEVKSLASGAVVKDQQIADCSILVTFKGYRRIFTFPYPISSRDRKVRIARKSSYIEIECRIRTRVDEFDLSLDVNPFPVARIQQTWNLLNVHYLQLDDLPALRLPIVEKKINWMSVHFGMSLSDRERALGDAKASAVEKGALLNLKESISNIICKWIDSSKNQVEAFGLHNPQRGGTYTLIFVNDIKLDLGAHTIVADACVVPLTKSLIPQIFPVLQRLTNVDLVTDDDEMRAWRKLLPILAERCRTWQHTSNCEYLSKGIPIGSLDGIEESPICSCGKGKNLGAFGANPKWKMIHKEAIRIAIGPLFTTSFLQDSMVGMKGATLDGAKRMDDRTSSSDTNAFSEPTNLDKCANCGGSGQPTLQMCSACNKIKYCSKSCQKSHWKIHKTWCKFKPGSPT